MDFRTYLIEHLWIGLLLVTLLYLLDYRLSIIGYRWFKRGADQHYDMGGSYELNPPFQADIEAERDFSARHLVSMLPMLVLLTLTWVFAVYMDLWPEVYVATFGFFVLVQAPVQLRHAQNIVLFRYVVLNGAVDGRTRAQRWLELKLSGTMFWFFGIGYAVLWLLTGDALFIGGVAGAALMGARFWIFGSQAEEGVRANGDDRADHPAQPTQATSDEVTSPSPEVGDA